MKPSMTWEQLDKIIHKVKYNLEKVVEVEKLCRTLKKEMLKELDELHNIILQQLNGDKDAE